MEEGGVNFCRLGKRERRWHGSGKWKLFLWNTLLPHVIPVGWNGEGIPGAEILAHSKWKLLGLEANARVDGVVFVVRSNVWSSRCHKRSPRIDLSNKSPLPLYINEWMGWRYIWVKYLKRFSIERWKVWHWEPVCLSPEVLSWRPDLQVTAPNTEF